MDFKIPEQYKSGIEFILNTNDDAIDVIISALRDFPPTVENVVYKISERIVQIQKIDRHTALSLVVTLVSLRQLYKEENLSNEAIVALVNKSIEQDADFAEFFSLKTEQIERFKRRLSSLLKALENIGFSLDISDKASDLLIEYERIFSDSRIVTDIRPVFDSETERKVEAAILIHTLKIQYKDAEGTKEFYVALDSDDLDNLHEQIVIAIDNRDALGSVLKKAEIECINPVLEIEALENIEDNNEQQD
ncbi:hypothetical protein [Nostoc sp. ChiSLP03a]|uniref:hypothetical protein n=1 Tax=Nostoc sp. ChiSLP03a TaxID=3075380 RepID=UPI002AD54C99|nr:hypothetical protein [Nostoc sp. ChiSLP03a]MDZ8214369.1 hypothetical protein [Nostoc sp. ChiSLP03a]